MSDSISDFLKSVAPKMARAVKAKKALLVRGSRTGHVKCTCGEGRLRVALVGPKDHLRVWCSACDFKMME